jgi:hypothetical protein
MGERWTRPERFRHDELEGDATAGEQAQIMATARELEWLAAADDVAPTTGFADRVMAAVAAEPTPRPVSAAASAARRGAFLGVLTALGDLWRVAWTGGRPLSVRAPAMALVVVLMAATVGAGALGVGALGGLLNRPDVTPPPLTSPSPSPATPIPSPSPSISPAPSGSRATTPEPSGSPTTTPEPSERPEPTETPEATRTPEPGATAVPTARPTAGASPRPTSTAEPTATPGPSKTPQPGETPRPTETPKPGETAKP